MPSLEREANRLRSLVDDADTIIVGIGSGMSSAAGFNHYRLLPLHMSRATVVVWGGSKRPLVSTLRVVAPDIIPADVKATSQAPFPHP